VVMLCSKLIRESDHHAVLDSILSDNNLKSAFVLGNTDVVVHAVAPTQLTKLRRLLWLQDLKSKKTTRLS